MLIKSYEKGGNFWNATELLSKSLTIIWSFFLQQHASRDVEKMILGNKCDMNDRRQVSKDRGEQVCTVYPSSFVYREVKEQESITTWIKKQKKPLRIHPIV